MGPRIRTASLTGYPTLARRLGLDPAELAAAVGLGVGDLEASDRWIPAAPVARLLELSAQRSGVEDFALLLSDLRRLGTLGPLSVVIRDEPDLRSALDLLVRYDRAYNEALHLRLSQDDVLVTISAWLEFGEPAPTGQAVDLVMATLLGIIRTLVGAGWEPLSVSFAHDPPAHATPYHRLFGPWVRFAQEHNILVFPVRDLDLPVVVSDASLRPYTHTLLEAVVGTRGETAAARLAGALEELLPLGLGSADRAGRRLGMTPRQLQRALAEEGETFSGVVHEVRAQLAERFLSDGRISLTELSRQLGFAAPSAFSRWFRQQFGTSPSGWRRAAAAAGAAPPPIPRPRDRVAEATETP
jgi:AraC-like DNA-binding protein